MKRRDLLAGLMAAPIFAASGTPSLAAGKKLSLTALSRYLNSLKNAKGAFTQINPDGSLSKGTFLLKRPGRMRFEYAAPNNSLVIAGQGKLAIFDKKSNTGPQQYPLHKTPLHIILKNNVNLSSSGMILDHKHDGTATRITAQDPQNPSYGNVQLVFTDGPTELRQWVVTDETGGKTTVVLGALETDKRIPGRLFDINKMARDGKFK